MRGLMKRCGMALFAVAAAAVLSGCSQADPGNNIVPVVSAADKEAVAILTDISTTQYFTEEAVSQKDMETIVQAGINAPSAMNGQPWHFSVITDAEVLQQISDGMGGAMGFAGPPQGGPDGEKPFADGDLPEGMTFPEGQPPAAPAGGSMNKAGITDAPLVIVVSCKAGSELDAGLACQNMSATAQVLGYGTKIVTSPTMALNGSGQDAYREMLGIPEGYSAAAILLIGHADTSVDENTDGYTGATARNPAEEMVTYITVD